MTWLATLGPRQRATTPVTDSGFVRLSLNRAVVGKSVPGATGQKIIRRLNDLPSHVFLSDPARSACTEFDTERLATSRQVTDFHLLAVAHSAGAVLTTMDKMIPSYLAAADRYLVELLLGRRSGR